MTHKNPLKDLHRFGVSVWYDYVSRSLISTGALQRLIEDDGVRGVTSNPTIFEKAIGGSSDYDDAIRRYAKPGQSASELFEKLAVEDIQMACDVFRPLYDESHSEDGYVSLEVAPALAQKHKEEELGDVLMAIVNVARFEGIDPEAALHAGVKKLTKRIEGVERGAEKRGKKIAELKEKDILALWREVKKFEKTKTR